jgi:uncharacterized protein
MDQRLIIDLGTLPEDGRQFSGELAPQLFELPAEDARPLGPLRYDLAVQRFGGELFLTGTLSARFEFTCVRTLHPFTRTIRLDQVPLSIEIGNSAAIDVTAALREEILLAFPANPTCDQADEPTECQIDPRYLAVDKGGGDGVETPPPPREDGRWAALDAWSEQPAQDEQ